MALPADAAVTGVTICSLNEIQVYGLRAARGSGLPWGLAEEAGWAARWLAARGLPGAEALASLLDRNDGSDYRTIAPGPGDVWEAPGGVLCPICTGSALADAWSRLSDRPPRLAALAHPLLLIPFLALNGDRRSGVLITWESVAVAVDAIGYALTTGDRDDLEIPLVDEVALAAVEAKPEQSAPPATGGVAVADHAWRQLQALAHRIYVPASDESRAKGAGAGLSDND